MKKLMFVLLACLITLTLLSGCSNGDKSNSETLKGCEVLNVYNWGEYIGEDVIDNFEKKYGVKVNYSMFDSNEAMYTKLLGGTVYDILVPSDYMIQRLIEEDRLMKIDSSKIPNLESLSENVISLRDEYDNGGQYSVPYFWGSVGIIYDKTQIDPSKIETMGWDILKDTTYKGDIFMYDSERDSFMVALKALGYSMNTENEEEINEAYNWLVELHQTMNPAYVTDEVNDEMINGSKKLAVVYSGAAAYIMSQNENMAFHLPKQGTNVWSDGLVIPKDSKCSDLAHDFINFSLSYDSALDSSITVGYTSSNEDVLNELSKEGNEYYGNEAYNLNIDNSKNEVFRHNEVLIKKLSELWVKVKIS